MPTNDQEYWASLGGLNSLPYQDPTQDSSWWDTSWLNPTTWDFGSLADWLPSAQSTTTALLNALTAPGTPGAGTTGSALGSLLTAGGGTAAALIASQQQAEAQRQALAAQQQQFAKTQANLQPWLTAGANALQAMQGDQFGSVPTLNLPNTPTLPGAPILQGFSYDPNQYFDSPVYQALLKSGMDAQQANAAARGMTGSGNQMAELQKLGMGIGAQYMGQDYNQALGQYNTGIQAQTQNYQNQINQLMNQYNLDANQATQLYNAANQGQTTAFNRLASMAGVGQTAGTNLGQLGAASANAQGNALVGIGNAGATGTANMFNQAAGGLNALLRL